MVLLECGMCGRYGGREGERGRGRERERERKGGTERKREGGEVKIRIPNLVLVPDVFRMSNVFLTTTVPNAFLMP